MKIKEMEYYIGKHILVGITYVDSAGNVFSQKQLHGNISRIEPNQGIFIKISGSETEFIMPLDFSVIQEAQPGEYILKTTGETVINPDFTALWRVEKP